MKTFLTLFFLCHAVSAVKHSLEYFLTYTPGATNFPEFVGTATVDGVEVAHCDSIIGKAEPRQHWLGDLMEDNPYHFKWYSKKCFAYQQIFKSYIDLFKHHLNQTGGSHILQRISGCEWDDEIGEVKAFNQYGYDGEDFISLDLKNETWITPKAEAVEIKHLWDSDKERIAVNKQMYVSECPSMLMNYMFYGRTFLQRTVRPIVTLLQKTPSSPVSCHATGFYPHKADLFWRKDGEEIHEDVEKGEILPNNDGTFQMSSELNVSLVQQEDWRKYDCVFQLSGLKEDIITTLKKAKIHGNWEFSVHHHAVGIIATGVLLLVLCGVLYWCWRERNDFQPMHDDLE